MLFPELGYQQTTTKKQKNKKSKMSRRQGQVTITSYSYKCANCDYMISADSKRAKDMLVRLHKKKCKKTGMTEKGWKEWKNIKNTKHSIYGMKTNQENDVEMEEVMMESWFKVSELKLKN